MEYASVQFECNAADERAKLLASEVIGLEEKVTDSGIALCCQILHKALIENLKWILTSFTSAKLSYLIKRDS